MKNSHIQWTDHTFNGWEGCTKVSPGCANCYAEARNARFGGGKAPNWGPGAPRRRTSVSNWNEPRKWNRDAQAAVQAFNQEVQGSFGHLSEMMEAPRRPRVFSAALADWLDDEIPIEWLADFLTLVFDCGFLDWQLLSKRPGNFRKRIYAAAAFIHNHREKSERYHAIATWLADWAAGTPPDNVWVGTTVEDQTRADERVPLLLAIPAVIHFLSCEPLLERVTFDENWFNNRLDESKGDVDWVIVGGESGPGARATSLDAIEQIIWECRDAKVACFVKQLGAKPRIPEGPLDLRHSKGGDPAEWPERFQVQEFPEVTP